MDVALSEAIGRTLRDFRATHGDAVLDRERCGSALLDMHKAHPAAIRAVLAAIDSGGARRLGTAEPALATAAIEREARRLSEEFGLGPDYARGAMTAWALALGLDGAIVPAGRGPVVGDAAGKTDAGKAPQGQATGGGPKTTETGGTTTPLPRRLSTFRRVVLSIGAVAAAVLVFLFVRGLVPAPRLPQVEARMEAPASWQPGDPGDRQSRRIVLQITVWNPAASAQAVPRLRAVARIERGENDYVTVGEWPIQSPQATLGPYARISFRAAITVADGANLERTARIWLGIGD